jgi:hypothetical protein
MSAKITILDRRAFRQPNIALAADPAGQSVGDPARIDLRFEQGLLALIDGACPSR